MESEEIKKEGELSTEPISQKAYREHMKNAINLLKLDHEYEKLKSEILQYKLISYQCIEGLAAYQAKEQPKEEDNTVTEE
jgi:superfamily II RNA helicase